MRSKKIILMMMGLMLMNGFSQTAKGSCPAGQVDIDDKGTCKKLVKVKDKSGLVAEIKKAVGLGTEKLRWTANLNYIDTSSVTDMSYLFAITKEEYGVKGYGLEKFKGCIDKWDVGHVMNMVGMFYGSFFNQPIENWNVSSVTDMSGMFFGATAFNQPIGDWNVSNVTTMEQMFCNALSFNQPIGNWNVSSVRDMIWMFSEAESFSQDINEWDVSNVTDMADMFSNSGMETLPTWYKKG